MKPKQIFNSILAVLFVFPLISMCRQPKSGPPRNQIIRRPGLSKCAKWVLVFCHIPRFSNGQIQKFN
jgi:hypothetical protein